MPAIAATRRAQAADSTRDHDSTAPAPEVPAVVATNDSNMHSNLLAAAKGCANVYVVDLDLWMNRQLWTTPPPGREDFSGACYSELDTRPPSCAVSARALTIRPRARLAISASVSARPICNDITIACLRW